MPLTGEAKRNYQRLYMRQRRRTAREVQRLVLSSLGKRGLRWLMNTPRRPA